MAFDAFLKLDGIEGESKDSKHKDEIQIESFSWGLSNSGTLAAGGGGGTGKSSFQDFSFTADISKASPLLFLSCANGKHIKEGLITIRSAGGSQNEYYTVKLTDVLVSAYNQAGSTDGDRPMDEFALRYDRIDVEYRTQNPDGSPGDSVKAGWDISAVKSA